MEVRDPTPTRSRSNTNHYWGFGWLPNERHFQILLSNKITPLIIIKLYKNIFFYLMSKLIELATQLLVCFYFGHFQLND